MLSFQVTLQNHVVGGGWIFQTPEFTHTHLCLHWPALSAKHRLVSSSRRLPPTLTSCDPLNLYMAAFVCVTRWAEPVQGRKETLGNSLASLSEALGKQGQEPSRAFMVCTATAQTSSKSCRDWQGSFGGTGPQACLPSRVGATGLIKIWAGWQRSCNHNTSWLLLLP